MLTFILIVYGMVAVALGGTMLWMDRGMIGIWKEAFLLGVLWPLWIVMAAMDGF